MTMAEEKLHVTTHIARDLLQSSAVFEHERLVVWEYVSNGLDYVDPGVSPIVKVHIDNKNRKITVIDNGRGMDFEGLHNFFTMHGENLDRKNKRRVRGFFGTGKSAAFGIAGILRVTTIENGKRSKVELLRKDIEEVATGAPVPVHVLENEQTTSETNGTIVEIEKVHLKHIDQASIIDFVEQHLARWNKDATVFINNQQCEFKEPPVREVHVFKPEGDFKEALGNIELRIKVSKTPLDEDFQGIAIFSNNVWYETTLAGSERKDQANLLFGEVDVPELDSQGNAEIPAYDLSRRMKLNKKNPLVQKIHAFIGIHLEQVRKKLSEEEQERKKGEQAKKLKSEANKIAEIINKDFLSFSKKLKSAQAKVAGTIDVRETVVLGSGKEEVLDSGGDIDAVINRLSEGSEEGDVSPIIEPGSGPVTPNPDKPDTSGLEEAESASDKNAKKARGEKRKSTGSGGFNVEFVDGGADAPRASYESAARTIWINLEHPQLVAALSSGGIEDVKFQRLAYEVAFSEYAVGLVHEMNSINWYFDVEDAIYDVREILNRISRAAAQLYASD